MCVSVCVSAHYEAIPWWLSPVVIVLRPHIQIDWWYLHPHTLLRTHTLLPLWEHQNLSIENTPLRWANTALRTRPRQRYWQSQLSWYGARSSFSEPVAVHSRLHLQRKQPRNKDVIRHAWSRLSGPVVWDKATEVVWSPSLGPQPLWQRVRQGLRTHLSNLELPYLETPISLATWQPLLCLRHYCTLSPLGSLPHFLSV